MNEQMTSQANNKTNLSNEDEVLLVPMKGGEEVLDESRSIVSPNPHAAGASTALQHTKVVQGTTSTGKRKKGDDDDSAIDDGSMNGGGTKRARGFQWNADELLLLSKAWSSTSEDEAVGTDQSSTTFWGRVHTKFEQLKEVRVHHAIEHSQPDPKYPYHSPNDIKKQWSSSINPACQLFTGICAGLPRKSGEQDEAVYEKQMLAVYVERAKTKSRLPKTFDRFLPAYTHLKGTPKFSSHFINGEGHKAGDAKVSKSRPLGRDAAKRNKKAQTAAGTIMKTLRVSSILLLLYYYLIIYFLCCVVSLILFISQYVAKHTYFLQTDSLRIEEEKKARHKELIAVMQQLQHQVAMQCAPQEMRNEYFKNTAALATKMAAIEMKKAQLEELKLNLEIKKLTNILGGDDVGEDVEGKEVAIMASVYYNMYDITCSYCSHISSQ